MLVCVVQFNGIEVNLSLYGLSEWLERQYLQKYERITGFLTVAGLCLCIIGVWFVFTAVIRLMFFSQKRHSFPSSHDTHSHTERNSKIKGVSARNSPNDKVEVVVIGYRIRLSLLFNTISSICTGCSGRRII